VTNPALLAFGSFSEILRDRLNACSYLQKAIYIFTKDICLASILTSAILSIIKLFRLL